MATTGNGGGPDSVATIEGSRPPGLMDEVAEYEGPGQAPNAFLVVIDDEGMLLYASLTALAAFGLSQGDALGTSLFRYVEAGDLERVLVHHSMVLQSPETVVGDSVHFVSGTTEAKTFEIETSNRLHHAEVTGIVMRGREVTERDRFRTSLRASLDQGSDAVSKVMHSADPFTAGHQQQVTAIATAIAYELQLGSDAIRGIEVAAALHDIGEIADTSGALTRPGALSGREFEKVKLHAEAGAQIISGVSFPWPVADMIRQHHERLDGSGYPSGLSGGPDPPGVADHRRGRRGLGDVLPPPLPTGHRGRRRLGRGRGREGQPVRRRCRRRQPAPVPREGLPRQTGRLRVTRPGRSGRAHAGSGPEGRGRSIT